MAKATAEQYADLEACIQNTLCMAMLAAFTGNKETAEHYSQRLADYSRQRRELRAQDEAAEQTERAD